MKIIAQIARTGMMVVIAATAVIGSVAVARAHELVDEGRNLYEMAEFSQALEALARAEAADDLEFDDVIVLFETRALVHLAMGEEDAMEADLRRLVAIAPTHVAGASAPPDVRRMIENIRAEEHGRLRVRASTAAAAAGITISVEVQNDWADVVRELRTYGRVQNASQWEHVSDAPLLVTARDTDVVEYYAEAIGPGGAVLARSGSPTEPLRTAGSDPGIASAGGGDEVWPWVVSGGAVLAAAAIVVTIVMVTMDSGTVQTQVEPFVVRF